MTPAERALLREVFRWAYADGIEFGVSNWATRRGPIEQRWGIDYDPVRGDYLTIWRGRTNGRDFWVASVAEAVDVLVALGILPARFSTAYRAGWDNGHGYAIGALLGAELTAIRPVTDVELVRQLRRAVP